MWPGTSAVKWLAPWHPIQDAEAERVLAQELRAELSKRHVLHGIAVRAVGRRQDCDDVLFELLHGSGRFAVVHLTYSQHPEPDPRWPDTTVYDNWPHFEREACRRMQRRGRGDGRALLHAPSHR